MYKAIDTQSETAIIILSPLWQGHLQELREMAERNQLVCQACRQALRVRAGRRRRRHFAHKHLAGCSYGTESPEVLEARAVLYGWLAGQLGDSLTLEHRLEGSDLPRAIDCWVDEPGKVMAYWIIDARMKWEARERVKSAFSELGIPVTWVMLSSLLQPDPERHAGLRLSPTERDFLAQSQYDQAGSELSRPSEEWGQTMHYLDWRGEKLITYRSLVLVHAPNIFLGTRLEHPLEQVRLDPQTVEPVHPGEAEALLHTRQELERRAQAQEEARRWREALRQPVILPPAEPALDQRSPEIKARTEPQPTPAAIAPRIPWSGAYPCVHCSCH